MKNATILNSDWRKVLLISLSPYCSQVAANQWIEYNLLIPTSLILLVALSCRMTLKRLSGKCLIGISVLISIPSTLAFTFGLKSSLILRLRESSSVVCGTFFCLSNSKSCIRSCANWISLSISPDPNLDFEITQSSSCIRKCLKSRLFAVLTVIDLLLGVYFGSFSNCHESKSPAYRGGHIHTHASRHLSWKSWLIVLTIEASTELIPLFTSSSSFPRA